MKKLMFLTMSLCALLLAAASCSSNAEKKLIGKWEQIVDINGMECVSTYEFKEDGKMHQTMVIKNDSPVIDIQGEADCDYTFEKDVITFKFSGEDISFSKFEMEGLPNEMVQASMEAMKSSLVDEEQKLTDVKIDGNELTAKSQGVEIKMTRM